MIEDFEKEITTFKYLPPDDDLLSKKYVATTSQPDSPTKAVDETNGPYPEYDIRSEIEEAECDPLELLMNIGPEDYCQIYLQPIFSDQTGEIVYYEEKFQTDSEFESSAQNSMSIKRQPDPKAFNILLGSSNNIPFMPGGFDDEQEDSFSLSDHLNITDKFDDEEEIRFLDFNELLTIPPGFDHPIDLSGAHKSTENIDNEESNIDNDESNSLSDSEISERDFSSIFDVLNEIKSFDRKQSRTNIIKCDFNDNNQDVLIDCAVKPAPIMKSKDEPYEYARRMDITASAQKFQELLPNLIRNYPFQLDAFQQQAILCMEEGTSVFVAAHTSAGKTVVAEYAIALCKAHRTRVIYTSPIKALSNQKFREFKLAFGDIGLVTGDIQLNSEGFCLVMTTEILRSMLYNGSEVVRELEWVIFDEVHYINDQERGHVWEEVLIMLPSHVKIVMLSATVPNCLEFADWVGRIKNRTIYVMETRKRPVPLEHYLYTGQDGKTKNDIFKIMDKDGHFSLNSYQKAVESKEKKIKEIQAADAKRMATERGRGRGRGGGQRGGHYDAGRGRRGDNSKNIYTNLIDYLKNKDLLPLVAFVFSRKRCDTIAQLLSHIDLTNGQKEKWKIKQFFTKCIDRLKGSDKQLPQVCLMEELCSRGFAIHHAGILPIVKEVVELLFQQGLIRVLLATETFAMGINMPARSVAFDSLEKFDPSSESGGMRSLNPTEYIQMAGRAGRRGLDETGTVVIITKDQVYEAALLRSIMMGKPISLESKFRVTYSMLLNLLRVECIKIEEMLQRSFIEKNSYRLLTAKKERIRKINDEISDLPKIDCPTCTLDNSLVNYCAALRVYFHSINAAWIALQPTTTFSKYLMPGQILLISYTPAMVGRLAVFLEFSEPRPKVNESGELLMTLLIPTMEGEELEDDERLKEFLSLVDKEEKSWRFESTLLQHTIDFGLERMNSSKCLISHNYFRILQNVGLNSLMAICRRKVKITNVKVVLDDAEGRGPQFEPRPPCAEVTRIIQEIDDFAQTWSEHSKTDEGDQCLHMLGTDITSKEFETHRLLNELLKQRQHLVKTGEYDCLMCPSLRDHSARYLDRLKLEECRDRLRFQTSSSNLLMSTDYAARLSVLRYLSYVDESNIVGLRGKVACEVGNQELLITELMLDGKFNSRSSPDIAAMLSSLTCQFSGGSRNQQTSFQAQKQQEDDGHNDGGGVVERVPKGHLSELRRDVMSTAERIDKIQRKFGVSESICDQLNFALMEPVYQWANDMAFSDIMSLTEAQEGLIVRCIQRLDEVCHDIRKAARLVGDNSLFEKMGTTCLAIRRDIVFAASLYTTEE